MTWNANQNQGNEAGKIKWELVKWTRGTGLDIGCGNYKPFPHFIGVDSGADIIKFGHSFRPDMWIEDASKLQVFADEQMDFVFSSHLLEHIEEKNVVKTLKEWMRVLKLNGYLILYLPHEDLYPKVGEKHANPDHKWDVNYQRVHDFMEKAGCWDLMDFQMRDGGEEYSAFFVFQKKRKGHFYSCNKQAPTEKKAAVVRYGAFGDLLQASSVLAGLKKQGFHVTLYCSPPAADVVKHDPNIDEFYYQDVNQVLNQELEQFWNYHRQKFDRWVNLSESVEGSLLTIPGRPVHTFPPKVRHEMLNRNYLEVQHALAGVPHEPAVLFYPTEEEVDWAKREKEKMGGFTIVWALAGSSVHKNWMWVDNVMATMLLEFPDVNFVMVGGPDCIILEQGWFKVKDGEPIKDAAGRRIMVDSRVKCTSGDWSIRQTMAFCQQADMVIGPETGVLNAVAHLPMPKVCLLSHSTDENLTRDWDNAHVIFSNVTECPGRGKNEAPACHQLHYNWSFCKRAKDEKGEDTGIAQCMYDIPPDHVIKVVWHAIKDAKGELKVA
jgi:ADP-heptose:LPS heptosyltransferase/predicted SAM-dependent methyltransferase